MHLLFKKKKRKTENKQHLCKSITIHVKQPNTLTLESDAPEISRGHFFKGLNFYMLKLYHINSKEFVYRFLIEFVSVLNLTV